MQETKAAPTAPTPPVSAWGNDNVVGKTYRSASGLAVPFDYLVNWLRAGSCTDIVLGWSSVLENAQQRARDFADGIILDYNCRHNVAAGTPHAAVLKTSTANTVLDATSADAAVVTIYTIERPLVAGWLWNSVPKHIGTVTVRTIVHVNDVVDAAVLMAASRPPPLSL